MGRIGKRITTIITAAMIITIIVLLFYLDNMKNKDKKAQEASIRNEAAEQLLDRDMEEDYPSTPEEVAEYCSNITEMLYSGTEDSYIEALAMKIREIYDDEFLENNEEEKYLTNLYSDIAAWKKAERTIINYVVLKDDEKNIKTIDGREYATIRVSYTIMEKVKVSEVRKYLLRKDEAGRWKIFGWETEPKKDNQNNNDDN